VAVILSRARKQAVLGFFQHPARAAPPDIVLPTAHAGVQLGDFVSCAFWLETSFLLEPMDAIAA
jgi:hypothetical protein